MFRKFRGFRPSSSPLSSEAAEFLAPRTNAGLFFVRKSPRSSPGPTQHSADPLQKSAHCWHFGLHAASKVIAPAHAELKMPRLYCAYATIAGACAA
jgi:hypothetical protein